MNPQALLPQLPYELQDQLVGLVAAAMKNRGDGKAGWLVIHLVVLVFVWIGLAKRRFINLRLIGACHVRLISNATIYPYE